MLDTNQIKSIFFQLEELIRIKLRSVFGLFLFLAWSQTTSTPPGLFLSIPPSTLLSGSGFLVPKNSSIPLGCDMPTPLAADGTGMRSALGYAWVTRACGSRPRPLRLSSRLVVCHKTHPHPWAVSRPRPLLLSRLVPNPIHTLGLKRGGAKHGPYPWAEEPVFPG